MPQTDIVDCRGAVVLGESDAKLADTQVALAAAKAQLAAHDKHLASQDATIKGLIRKQASVLAITTVQKFRLGNCLILLLDAGPARGCWSVILEIIAHQVQVSCQECKDFVH